MSAPDPAEAEARLRRIVAASPILAPILDRWAGIGLPDCWLSGGAVAQTAWNHVFGLAPDHGLADVDLVYFDAADLSDTAEAAHAARIRALFPNVPLPIDVKNEARVHLWYEAAFGYRIAPYRSTRHAIATFPTTAGAVGIRPAPGGLSIVAPFGLADLLTGTVRPNKAQITRAIYDRKVARWRACWPSLTIVEWEDDR